MSAQSAGMTGGREGVDALALLAAAFDRAAASGAPREIWWRDDDAVAVGPRLEGLLSLAARCGAPLALAVIPALVTERFMARCAEATVAILQHGVSHANHEPDGKPAELGSARPVAEIVSECVEARARIDRMPGFLGVMVPPWNRMRPDLTPALAAAGYTGVSLFGGEPDFGAPRRVDTHLDPVAWRGDRGLLPPEALAAMTARALEGTGPIGLLTHHAIHDAATSAFVARVVSLVSDHPGAAWRDAAALFGPAGPTAP